MSEYSTRPRATIVEVVVWCIATPILSFWALISLLPIVGVIRAWGDVGEVLIAAAFLATGAVGLAAAAVGYRLLLWQKLRNPMPSSATRTLRIAALSAYAVIWMAFYAL
jgi:hypothetical protein